MSPMPNTRRCIPERLEKTRAELLAKANGADDVIEDMKRQHVFIAPDEEIPGEPIL